MKLTNVLDVLGLAFANEINALFSAAMVAIFVVALANTRGQNPFVGPKSDRVADSAPATLPALGILGTFLGICIGLLQFNPSTLEQSVPLLLEGMKTAFVTSVVGISLGVLLKLFSTLLGSKREEASTVDDAIFQMSASMKGMSAAQTAGNETLARIRASIAGDEDASLVTQLQKLRTETKDANETMVREFREFAKTMAENNSKALIEALEEVIRDFNTKLTEQFGENFKELNRAVGALLVWQENYKDQVEQWLEAAKAELQTLRGYVETSAKGLQSAEVSLQSIAHSTSGLPMTVDKLRALIESLQAELELIKQGLGGMAQLRVDASKAIPEVNTKLNAMVEGLRTGVDQMVKNTNAAVETQDSAVKQQRKQLEDMNRQSREAFEKIIRDTGDNLAKQITNLDDTMKEELKRAIEVMGGHLASLSNKFVQDYGPLTDKLRQVVELANGSGYRRSN